VIVNDLGSDLLSLSHPSLPTLSSTVVSTFVVYLQQDEKRPRPRVKSVTLKL
jgi:hypothetical protein